MLLAEYDYDTDIAVQREESFDLGHERGLIEGEARGKSLGLAEGKLETARNLRTMGLSIEDISKATGLTVQEVEQL